MLLYAFYWQKNNSQKMNYSGFYTYKLSK